MRPGGSVAEGCRSFDRHPVHRLLAGWRADVLLRVVLCLVFAFVVIKAASADLTWDEAWTFLFYGRTPLGFTRLDYANDHPLNSILIWCAGRLFGNSELIIRLPNVLAAGIYLWASARLIGRVQLKLLAFAICVLQPYLMDYFALARGYGLAAALVQVGLVEHFFVTPGRRYGVLLATLLLASLSIFSTVTILFALVLSHSTVALLSRGERRPLDLPLSLAALAAGLAPVAGLLWVSRDGVPLYGSTSGFFDAVLRGIARMYVPNSWSAWVAIGLCVAVAILLVLGGRRFGPRARTLLLASALCLGAAWISARALGKPLPTGRVLLPWMPLFYLAVVAMAEDVWAAGGPIRRRWVAASSAVLCAGLALIFVQKLHFQRYSDWPEDYRLQNRLVQALTEGGCLPAEVWGRYGHVYYLDRWFPPGRRPPDVECPSH